MKIQGPNQPNFNPYKNIIQKQATMKDVAKKDHVEISSQAKQLQELEKTNVQREKYVQEIKNAVQSGEYKVNAEETAKKMIDFFTKG